MKRRQLQEPGYGTSDLMETSEMVEDDEVRNAGAGEVDDNRVRMRKRDGASMGEAVEVQRRAVSYCPMTLTPPPS